MYLFAICLFYLVMCSSLFLIFCLVVSFLLIFVPGVLYVFLIKGLYHVDNFQLSSSLFLIAHSLNSDLQVAEEFYLNVIQFIMLFLSVWMMSLMLYLRIFNLLYLKNL